MPDTIPFLDLRAAYNELREELDRALLGVASGGRYLLGSELQSFEHEWASYLDVKHCIGVGNGLDALKLTLLAMGVRPGDEVIVPSMTFIATWLAVSDVGATPIPVEPDPATYNLDPERLEAAISKRTKAVIPVHLYGQPADMEAIMEICERRGVACLEDAAQAHGARIRGRRVGGMGHAAAWSMYPGKNLGALGDGGAVTTNDDGLAARVRTLRNYGSSVKYVHELKGFNSRLDDIQAAALRVKLRHLDEWNERRVKQAALYSDALADTGLVLPAVPEWTEPVWHLYVVRTPDRAHFQKKAAELGVETIIHYPRPPHEQAAYADLGYTPDQFPLARQFAQEVVSLPIGPHLSHDQQQRVIDVVRSVAAEVPAGSVR